MMDDMTLTILKLVIITILIVFSRYIIPYLKIKMEDTKIAYVAGVVNDAVRAAEQTIKLDGTEKKAIVTKMLRNILRSKNISISDEQLNSLIESAVLALKQ